MKSSQGIQLGNPLFSLEGVKWKRTYRELATKLEQTLIDPPIDEIYQVDVTSSLPSDFDNLTIAEMIKIAEDSALIELGPNNILSFTYKIVEEYFVAQRCSSIYATSNSALQSLITEIITDVENWYKPLRIWTSLLPDPKPLANDLALIGQKNFFYGQNALTLGILCMGVNWRQAQLTSDYSLYALPNALEELLIYFLTDDKGIDKLVAVYNRCAQEDSIIIYRSLIPLIIFKPIEKLLLRLNRDVVANLLFDYLPTALDVDTQGAKAVITRSILGKLGSNVIPRATELSKTKLGLSGSELERHIHMREAAIYILGRTHEEKAVEPLIACLGESGEIKNATFYALLELGPAITIDPLLKELEHPVPYPPADGSHLAALDVLRGILIRETISLLQHQNIIEMLVHVLSSTYAQSMSVQQNAKSLILQEAEGAKPRREKVIRILIRDLSHSDTSLALSVQGILIQIGRSATTLLLDDLNQPRPEIAHVRLIDILKSIRDVSALPDLISLLSTPSSTIKAELIKALVSYAPESVPLLIDLILSPEKSYAEALDAVYILKTINEGCGEQIIQNLARIVPGRTELLIAVLIHTHDQRAIIPLIELLKVTQMDSSIAIAITYALGQIPDKKSVKPLINILQDAHPRSTHYETAIDALSLIGSAGIGINDIIMSLDQAREIESVRGIQQAFLRMKPFPEVELLNVFTYCNYEHAKRIMDVFRSRGEPVSSFLVSHLCDQDEHIRDYVHQTLDGMEEHHIFESLLNANHMKCRPTVSTYLRKYSQNSTSRLVALLSDPQRGDAAALTLIDFGPDVIPSLASALNDHINSAHKRVQDILVVFVQQQVETLLVVIQLFGNLLNSPGGYEVLLSILTLHFAEISTPVLISELGSENPKVKNGVIEALIRLVRMENTHSNTVLQELLKAL